jgi:hypothetical protein
MLVFALSLVDFIPNERRAFAKYWGGGRLNQITEHSFSELMHTYGKNLKNCIFKVKQ